MYSDDDDSKKPTCKSLFGVDLATQQTQGDNMEMLLGLCSGKFTERYNHIQIQIVQQIAINRYKLRGRISLVVECFILQFNIIG